MSLTDTYCSLETVSAAIANGASLSGAINLYGLRPFGVVIPAEWTAANLTFQVSLDKGATWINMADQNGNEISATASAGTCVVLNMAQFASVQYLRLRSGTAATPVAQGGARTLQLILRAV